MLTLCLNICKLIDDVCGTKDITTCANQRPSLTTEVRAMLRVQNAAFKTGDMVDLRSARADLIQTIRVAKSAPGQKILSHFHDSRETRRMWQGIQMIMVDKTAPPPYDDNTDLLNELYRYF